MWARTSAESLPTRSRRLAARARWSLEPTLASHLPKERHSLSRELASSLSRAPAAAAAPAVPR